MQTENKITAMLKSDIKINVRLIGEDQSHTVNIQSVDAYFIHKDLRIKAEENKKHFKFLRRYPIEPCVNNLKSTICCLNNPGIYGYNTMPVGTCAPVYAGFGLNPHFHEHHCCFKNPEAIKAPVYYTADRSTVEVYFPAWLQKKVGDYDLIINAKLYDPEYHFNNLRTISISYETIVTLTETSTNLPDGISGVEINGDEVITPDDPIVDPDDPVEPIETDIYVESGSVQKVTDPETNKQYTGIVLDLANSDTDVPIDISSIVDWYEAD